MKKFIEESWLVLAMGVVFACLLAGAQTTFGPKISVNETKAMNEAIAMVVPGLDPAAELEKLDVEGSEVYRCVGTDGQLVGWAVKAEGGGFIDKITLVVGLSPDGSKVLGMKVVSHLETPGLGNKIDTKGEENKYPLQYAGKPTAKPLELVKRPVSTDHEIQAITGATYSSQFTMDIVNDVFKRIVPNLPRE